MIITTATTAATTTEQAAFRSALVAAFAKAAEIGEVRKRADGYEYKKIAAGKWQRLVGREHGKNKTPDTIPEPKKAPVKSGKPAPSAPAKSTSETPAAPAAPAAPAVEKYKADKTRIQSLAGPDLWANVVDGAPGASEAAMLVASLPDQFLEGEDEARADMLIAMGLAERIRVRAERDFAKRIAAAKAEAKP